MPTRSSMLLLLITLGASLQDGFCLPVPTEPKPQAALHLHPPRTKRCACSNIFDSECHYFCHLDIIWVNTPSKTTVYGLGGSLLRRKRSTSRCTCASPGDQTCSSFCHFRPGIHSVQRPRLDVLRTPRAAADRSKRARDVDGSPQAVRKIV